MRVTWLSRRLVVRDGETTSRFASSRYRALMPAAALRSRGIDADAVGIEAVASPPALERLASSDIVVFQKLSPFADVAVLRERSHVREGYAAAAEAALRALALVPVQARVVFDINDDGFEMEEFLSFYRSVAWRASGWITSSDLLAKRLRSVLGVAATVVPDGYEGTPGKPRAPIGRLARTLQGMLDRIDRSGQSGSRLALLWFGHPVSLQGLAVAADELLRATGFVGVDLLCVTALDEAVRSLVDEFNRRGGPRLRAHAIAWSAGAVWKALQDCDAVLLPADLRNPGIQAKSANRLLEAIVAGRLAICHPVPAYLEFQRYAWVGERMDDGLRWAIGHPREALSRIRAGQAHVQKNFGPAAIASRWLAALQSPGPAESPSKG
jgi:hypothetical protein